MEKAADGPPDVERALELQPRLSHAYDTRGRTLVGLGKRVLRAHLSASVGQISVV